jgi:simple sugar transport system ATP-binding protein
MFSTLKDMAKQGLSLIFISHKLDEVMATADRIFVLRGGKSVAERLASGTDKAELAELMVGREVHRPVRKAATPGNIVLDVNNASVREQGVDRLKQVSFHLREGEILGIIGVSGNGQTHLAKLLSGTATHSEGSFTLFGEAIEQMSVSDAVGAGIGRIPEDRNHEGVIGEMAIWENTVLERLSDFSKNGFVDRAAGIKHASTVIEEFDVRGGTPVSRIRLLSGGNMQKLILGRNLINQPRILIAAQPARGLDEGAVAAVHARILEARKTGTAVLLISEDLDEVFALADRIQAIVDGRLSRPVDAEQANARMLGLMMSGEWEDQELGHAV